MVDQDKVHWVCQDQKHVFIVYSKLEKGFSVVEDPNYKKLSCQPLSQKSDGKTFFVRTNKNRILFFDFPD
jgi:hypothetical protein